MRLFGLSSLDAMLTLLLLDGAWWTTVFLGQHLVILVYRLESMLYYKRVGFLGVSTLVCGGILFLRFKAPLILLITVLKNRVNEHCQILKIWYWVSIFLDLALVGFQLTFTIVHFDELRGPAFLGIPFSTYIVCFSFLVLRGLFWSLARPVVKELGSTENTLFPVEGCRGVFNYLGTHIESLLKILVSFEILWNGLLLFSMGVFIFSQDLILSNGSEYYFGGMLPLRLRRPVELVNLILSAYFFVVGAIQMLGVEKGWKTFLKVWVVVYMVGVGGFGLGIVVDMFVNILYSSLLYFIMYGLLALGQLALKVILVISTFKYLREGKGSAEEGDNEVFMQPLLPKEILAGKEPKFEEQNE